MSRSLDELKIRAAPALSASGEFRKKLIEIAATKSPSAAFDLAEATARNHGHTLNEALAVAKGVRWLAVIKRDYGEEELQKVTEEK